MLLLNMHATESEYNTETKLTAQASTAVTALNRYSRAQVRDLEHWTQNEERFAPDANWSL